MVFLGAGFRVPNFGTYKNEERGEVMKEKVNRAKEWVKSKWKKLFENIPVAILIICFVLLVALPVLALQDSINESKKNMATVENTDKKNEKEDSNTKNDSDSDKKKKEAASDQEKKADDAKAENDSAVADEKKADDGKQTAENNAVASTSNAGTSNQAASSNSSGSGGGSSQESSHTHSYTIPVYGTEQKWVVDQAAWAETINEPIYENKLVWYCNTCGADITADPEGHVDATMHGGYRSDYISVQTGTNTYTIDHPEQGHWESYSVVTGYQCSCGDIQ